MIIKSYETNKINIENNPFILLYGKNEGLKKQTIVQLLRNKTVSSKYEENEILNNSNKFFESVNSKSFFDDAKIIIITRGTDKILNIISEIIEKDFKDLFIIIDSDNLEKKSKLRSFFEKSKRLICVPFYPDTNETLSKLALQQLKNRKISISVSNINLVVDKCNGDRKILLAELEKIENYVKYGKKINTESLEKLINIIENHSISELIDNCLAKNKKKTINILIENNFNSEDSVLITKFLLNKLKKLLTLSEEFQKNRNLELTISNAKPPIFWKEKEITKQQILNWTPEKIRETLYKMSNIELKIKKNYENSLKLITDFIFDLTSEETNNSI